MTERHRPAPAPKPQPLPEAAPVEEKLLEPSEPAAETIEKEQDGSHLEAYLPASPSADAQAEREAPAPPRVAYGIRSARLVDTHGRRATVVLRGEDEAREIDLDPDCDAAVVREALETGERVMVEADEDGAWVVVGILRSRKPEKISLSAEVIEIEADREVTIRSGRGAMRIREDGEIEVVGSRISAASRGLFRLVGRMLRLN